MVLVYLILSTLALGYIFTIWSTSSTLNSVFKFTFFCLTVFGLFATAYHAGFVVRV